MKRPESQLVLRESRRVAPWRRALMILAAVAFFVLAITGPTNELCFGADGHFAIEPGHAQCPSDLPGSGGAPASGGSLSSSDTCADVSLRIDLRPDTGSRAGVPAPQPAPVCGFPHTVSIVAFPVGDLARVAALGTLRPCEPAALRTFVLRC